MKRIIVIVLVACVTFFLPGCDSLLEVKPRASLTEDQVLIDIASTQGLLNSLFAITRNGAYYGRDFVLSAELLADNCKLVNAGDRSGRGLNQSINLKGIHLGIWGPLYQRINSANLIIDAIDQGQIPVKSQADKATIDRIKAQALFMRALLHFDLVRTYSYNPNHIIKNWDKGVPIMTIPVKTKDQIVFPTRPTVVQVFQQIESDLLAAIDLFTATGSPDVSGSAVSARHVPTRASSYALMARVYLYWAGPLYPEKYPLATNFATLAINSGFATLSSATNLESNWVTTRIHPEAFFEVNFNAQAENLGGDNSLQGWYTRIVNAAGIRVNGWGDVIASDELIAAHNAADLRLSRLMQQARRDFEPVASRETRKFNNTSGTQFGLDNVPVLRLAEMYLIRAEASLLADTPDEVQARSDLNVVRARSFTTPPTPLDGTVTGAALIDELFLQRRLELAFEGHRWFDFTRRGLSVQKPSGLLIDYNDDRILANIPLAEVQANPNLQQNPGY